MKTTFRHFLYICIVFYISACSTLPEESSTNVEWAQHNALLSDITSFKATGKLGYRGPKRTVSLNFYWDHQPESSQLRLVNFLGSTVMAMTMTPDGATVITSNNQIYAENDANILFEKLTGLEFPVTQFQDWIKGQPTDADSFQLNGTNTVQELSKKSGYTNWRLVYNRYQDVDTMPLPYQMTLSKKDTNIKVVISKWELNP